MHYYQFNIADYRKDTAHLSPIEHYIYRSLIDWYYLDEQPIPKLTQSVMRRLSLVSEYSVNLDNVLNDFFYLHQNEWRHKRIDEEIERYHENSAKNKENGKKGGRPKKQQLTEDNKPKLTQSVILANPSESQINPNQEPITNNQEPITNKKLPFLDFYSKYPKKERKKEAKAKWDRLTLDVQQKAIDGVTSFTRGKETKYICAPIVYLNGERWEDEVSLNVEGKHGLPKRETKDFSKTDYSQIPEGFNQ